MLVKATLLVLAILVALWAAGVDFQSVKQTVTGAASDGAQSVTGGEDDWG